jgi:UDP-2-acetamido-3-amino-2,3-dideoxy-glucuronate N-acetyltransferase
VTTVAVIGTGNWGRRLIRVLADLGVLAMACNRGDPEGQAWVRASYPGIPISGSADGALSDAAIDCVAIATPIASHAALAIAALEAGKHVFVEKPLAMSMTDALRVIQAADRADRTLSVGHVFLFDPGIERLQALVADDPIEWAAFSWAKLGTFGEPLIWNLLPHEMSLAVALLGRPETIDVLDRASGQTELDRLRLGLNFTPPERACIIEIDRQSSTRKKTARVRTRAGVAYRWQDGDLSVQRVDGELVPLAITVEEPLVREMRAFIVSAQTGEPGRSDGRFGAQIVELIERVAILLATPRGASDVR